MGKNYREISAEELEEILEQHRLWLKSNGRKGQKANLQEASLIGADLKGKVLSNANLRNAQMYRVNLIKSELENTDLSSAILGGADMEGANLRGADLSEADLTDADLINANLRKANLQRADFYKANLTEADITEANAQNVRLSHAILHGANLTETNFTNAYLSRADLRNAVIFKTNFNGAVTFGVRVLSRFALTDAIGIEDHSGFVFEEDELEKEQINREERTERLFNVKQKGVISFSIPCNMHPIQIGLAFIYMSVLTEGLRLALTADYVTAEELSKKVADPALWTSKEEKYSSKLIRLQLRNPIEGALEIIQSQGTLIAGIITSGVVIWRTILNHKYKNKVADQAHEIAQRKLDLEERKLNLVEKNLPILRESEAHTAFKEATNRTIADLPEESKKIAQEFTSQIAGKVDNHEERLQYGVEIVLRTFDKLCALLRGLDAELKINGKKIDLEPRQPEEADK